MDNLPSTKYDISVQTENIDEKNMGMSSKSTLDSISLHMDTIYPSESLHLNQENMMNNVIVNNEIINNLP